MIALAIATEDELSETVGVRLAIDAGLNISMKLRRRGNGYLRGNIEKFAAMADNQAVLLITDLDRLHSPQRLKEEWLKGTKQPRNMLFHVAVREVEAWLLADHAGMKSLLGSKIGKLPPDPELLPDPKANFLRLAGKAPRDVRSDLVAERNSMASQGLGYNARLCAFVSQVWKPDVAAERAPSLAHLRDALAELARQDEIH